MVFTRRARRGPSLEVTVSPCQRAENGSCLREEADMLRVGLNRTHNQAMSDICRGASIRRADSQLGVAGEACDSPRLD